ncbi:fumarylacetoacetate hydrolase family protein [Siminovitchia terrae]|uniref:fumarylacetoacetate hydrolase family protein n=1 Tax=Siminovitchia terrae TaxID=1914933 RepID=UPI0028A90CD5|nr:fumarylacetoacetate hydrolase family protein [Siminovitchia terrae]
MSLVKASLQGLGVWDEIQVNPLEATVELHGQKQSVSHVSWNPPVTGTIYGVLLNYQGEYNELKGQFNEAPYKQPPKAPVLYIKPANTLSGCNQPIPLPKREEELVVGAALAVVIGKTATRINADDAYEYIEGYTIANDVSIPHESYYRPAIKQKARDGFCPVGPWIVSQDDVTDPGQLETRVYINGELKQQNNTKNLIRSIPTLLKDVTEFMTLRKGDVLLVGVPDQPPRVKDGDEIRIEIDGIGVLVNRVVSEEKLAEGGYAS